MFSETGTGNQISDQLRRDIEAIEKQNLTYKEMKKMKKEKKENFKNNKIKLVSQPKVNKPLVQRRNKKMDQKQRQRNVLRIQSRVQKKNSKIFRLIGPTQHRQHRLGRAR
jgi:flagellar biosynthesis GTPase FlhF